MKVQTFQRQIRLQEWASQIKAQNESGMTVREWCKATGIGYKNFYRRRKCVREEMLEALESHGNKSKELGLTTVNKKQLSVEAEPPVITPVNVPQAKGAALTVWIGHYAIDIQNGADAGTIDQVLRTVSRL